MKKIINGMFLLLLLLAGYSLQAGATSVPNTIETGTATETPQYLYDFKSWVLTTKDGNNYVYCETANIEFPRYKTLTRLGEVDQGFVHIIKNRPTSGSKEENFYVTQTAIYWYKDILIGGNTNLYESVKIKCTNQRNEIAVCNKIYNLVQGAKSYKEPKGSVALSSNTVTFSEVGEYYVSNTITVSSLALKTLDIKLVGAPSGSTIINKNITNNNGMFQVRVPISSVAYGSTISFKIEANGTYITNSAYNYIYTAAYQTVIYDKIFEFSHSVSASKTIGLTKKPAPTTTTTTTTKKPTTTTTTTTTKKPTTTTCPTTTTKKPTTTTTTTTKKPTTTTCPTTTKKPTTTTTKKADINSLTINKLDQDGKELKGAVLTLYKGDCTASTCSSSDAYETWITSGKGKVFTDIPVGYYTIEETSTPSGYNSAGKGLIYIRRADTNYSYSVVNVKETEVKPVKISKTDITGTHEIPGATLILRDSNGKHVETWVSTNSAKYIVLPEGEYSLIEQYAPEGYKLNLEVITFKVDKAGNVYSKNEAGEYALVEYVRMVNDVNNVISINKLDINTNNYLPGAVLELRNEKGELVASWTTTNQSYNISLSQGDYSVREVSAPKGYNLNSTVINFKVFDNGTVMVKTAAGGYESVGGIIIYNKPEEEYEIVVEVPKTGLTSTLTYLVGTMTLFGGSLMLKKNGKFN